MYARMKLRTKLLITGTVLTVVPLLVAGAVTLYQNNRMIAFASEQADSAARTALDLGNVVGLAQAAASCPGR